jgi:hypothetical protein
VTGGLTINIYGRFWFIDAWRPGFLDGPSLLPEHKKTLPGIAQQGFYFEMEC